MNIIYEDDYILIHTINNQYIVFYKTYNKDDSIDIIIEICGDRIVILDLLLANGINDRFYELCIKDNNIKYCNSIKCDIEYISIRHKEYILDNLYLLNNSILTKVQKFLIKRGKLL